jgi:short-subunit dehydrogenase
MAGKVPAPRLATYSATKHGVVGFTGALRQDLADTPVSASAICPGFVAKVGMYGRLSGVADPPPPMRPIEPQRVADAVVTAIRHDRAEIIVNGRGTKPLVLLAAAAPKLMGRLTRLGNPEEFRDSFLAAKAAAPETAAEQKVHAGD